MPLSLLDPYKRFLPLVVLVCIPLSWYWLDELLACRAMGGLLMLFPAPLLLCVRSHPSPWRLVLVTAAYLAIIKGMVLMLYPWHMRRVCHAMAASTALRLAGGAVGVLAGAAHVHQHQQTAGDLLHVKHFGAVLQRYIGQLQHTYVLLAGENLEGFRLEVGSDDNLNENLGYLGSHCRVDNTVRGDDAAEN